MLGVAAIIVESALTTMAELRVDTSSFFHDDDFFSLFCVGTRTSSSSAHIYRSSPSRFRSCATFILAQAHWCWLKTKVQGKRENGNLIRANDDCWVCSPAELDIITIVRVPNTVKGTQKTRMWKYCRTWANIARLCVFCAAMITVHSTILGLIRMILQFSSGVYTFALTLQFLRNITHWSSIWEEAIWRLSGIVSSFFWYEIQSSAAPFSHPRHPSQTTCRTKRKSWNQEKFFLRIFMLTRA